VSVTTHFVEGDVVGFRPFWLGKVENIILKVDGVKKYGWGPFRVKGIVEDRNGVQLHIQTHAGTEDILPIRWFVDLETHI